MQLTGDSQGQGLLTLLFNAFDENDDGHISWSELQGMLTSTAHQKAQLPPPQYRVTMPGMAGMTQLPPPQYRKQLTIRAKTATSPIPSPNPNPRRARQRQKLSTAVGSNPKRRSPANPANPAAELLVSVMQQRSMTVATLARDMDSDHNGLISWHEFRKVWCVWHSIQRALDNDVSQLHVFV